MCPPPGPSSPHTTATEQQQGWVHSAVCCMAAAVDSAVSQGLPCGLLCTALEEFAAAHSLGTVCG